VMAADRVDPEALGTTLRQAGRRLAAHRGAHQGWPPVPVASLGCAPPG
jgi:hypothetical protein